MEDMLNWASAAMLNVADAIFSPDEPEENLTGSSLIIPLALTFGLISAGLILRFLYVPETEPIVDDYTQTSTSADMLWQDCPQTPTKEPTPATDSSPRDGPVKINPTGSFYSLYEVGKKLSSKPHGIVHEGIRRSNGKWVLIKFVKKCQFDFQIGDSRPLCREAAIMRMVKHSDHVPKLYEWFDVEEHDILIMEHPGTAITLCDFIKRKGGCLAEAEAKDIMQKLVAALKYCSEQDVYHKDISLKKVLINSYSMQIKLTSFFKALSLIEIPMEGRFQWPERAQKRSDALMATNEGLYRVLKGMVKGGLLCWKNTSLSKECLDLLQKLHDKESGIILSNILAHDWFKTPDTTDVHPSVPDREHSQERPQTPEKPTDLTLIFPDNPTQQHIYFQSLYKVGKELRHGDRVHEGIRRSDGLKVEIKFVERCRLWEASPQFVEEGASYLKGQNHPNRVHFIQLYDRFILEDQNILIMEPLPDYVTLSEFIRQKGRRLNDETANHIMDQILVAGKCHEPQHYPLLKKFILINPKTMHIKYAHITEQDLKGYDYNDVEMWPAEDLEEILFLGTLLFRDHEQFSDHCYNAKNYLTGWNPCTKCRRMQKSMRDDVFSELF